MPTDIRRIGLGTYSDGNRDQWTGNVRRALDAGYRHVDTAEVYGNEEHVGEGIRRSDVARGDVFLATKTVHEEKPGPERETFCPASTGASTDSEPTTSTCSTSTGGTTTPRRRSSCGPSTSSSATAR